MRLLGGAAQVVAFGQGSGLAVAVARRLRSGVTLREGEATVPTIRHELRPGDLGAILRQHGLVYGTEEGHDLAFEAYVAETLAEFASRHDPARDRIWLCEEDGRLVGSLFLVDRGESAQLRYFLIAPEFRGRGLGRDLMARYMAALRAGGYGHSFLFTTRNLRTAALLYVRSGFVLTEERATTRFGRELIEQKYEWWATAAGHETGAVEDSGKGRTR